MNGERLLALDLGTGSCRAAIFDADTGEQVAIAQREYTHPDVPGVPGGKAFDCDRIWAVLVGCIREARGLAGGPTGSVKAVSASAIREGMVLYDSSGREIWACPNVDGRGGIEAAELVQSGLAQKIYEQAGDWVSITAPARLRWIARHQPDVFDAIAGIGMLGDWMLTRLSGVMVTDPSLGSSSGMFDLARRDWSDSVLDICGLSRSCCPPVVEPGTVIGSVSESVAAQTGLAAGTPVVVGGADTQLALLGLGVSQPGQVTVIGGTFWQSTAVLDEPLIDPQARLRTLCHAQPDRWMIEGVSFLAGLVMRWFRDAFCELEVVEAERRGCDVYELLEAKAAAVAPGSNGVVGIFSNVMQANRWEHASPSFMGFDIEQPGRSGRIECFRAIEESDAYVARGHCDIVSEVTNRPIQHVLFSGGASQGHLWPQILADVLGVPVSVPLVKESSSLGAALLAGVGAGLWRDPAEVGRKLLRVERTFAPQPEAASAYAHLYQQWREVYEQSLSLARPGLLRPLWRAGGVVNQPESNQQKGLTHA
jgi:autoinducer 2 (AI-2) kinase